VFHSSLRCYDEHFFPFARYVLRAESFARKASEIIVRFSLRLRRNRSEKISEARGNSMQLSLVLESFSGFESVDDLKLDCCYQRTLTYDVYEKRFQAD
jgi:hypothetical protein